MVKYSCAGMTSIVGVIAALLAEQGFTGGTEILDGDYGFYNLIGVDRLYPESLTENLGEKWWIDESAFKFYPSCRISHPAIDALYDIMKNNNLKAIIAYSKVSFYQIREKRQILLFLDTKIKNVEDDPDKRWITWNDYLIRIKYFFRWMYNCKDKELDKEVNIILS